MWGLSACRRETPESDTLASWISQAGIRDEGEPQQTVFDPAGGLMIVVESYLT
jgi:hypothetical protein